MENFAPRNRSSIFKFIVWIIILSPKLLTKVNVNELWITTFTKTIAEDLQSFVLNKAQVSVINPYGEQRRDSDTGTTLQCDLWTPYVYSDRIGSNFSKNPVHTILLTYLTRNGNNTSVANTTSQLIEIVSHILSCNVSLPNNVVKSIGNANNPYDSSSFQYFHNKSFITNPSITRTIYRAIEYILIFLFIMNRYFNSPKDLRLNICKDSFGKHRKSIDSSMYFKSKSVNDTPESIFNMLFSLRVQSIPPLKIVVNPSSMESYLQDIKNKTSTQELMKNEWARYNSFCCFPKTSYMTPIRLSQVGFYYSGAGELVICFSCGQKYDAWIADETASEVHRRISPNCAFMCGKDNSNISIHDSSDQGSINSSRTYSNATHVSANEHQEANVAYGGPDDIHKATISATETNLSSKDDQTSQAVKINAVNTQVCEEDPIVARSITSNTGAINQRSRLFRSTTTISYTNAKHPEYAVKAVREDSFIGWREHISSVDLSEAGFYYAGFQDCVRCFYCGGGLKNWDYGDSPWVEHARWYPSCDYMRQMKGEEFVQRYREDCGTEEQQQTTNNMRNRPEISASCSANEGNTNMHHTLDMDMNSAAVTSVLEIGYTRDTVENAAKTYRQLYGNRSITAELLMDIILDSDQSQTIQSSRNTSASSITTTFNITTRTETTSHNKESASDIAKSAGQNDKEKSKPTTDKPRALKRAEYTSLVEENRSLREQMLCKICMDNDANIVFLPCGHLVACAECAPAIKKCAVCMKLIKGTVRAFPS